jgi:hypothetical protein
VASNNVAAVTAQAEIGSARDCATAGRTLPASIRPMAAMASDRRVSVLMARPSSVSRDVMAARPCAAVMASLSAAPAILLKSRIERRLFSSAGIGKTTATTRRINDLRAIVTYGL